jgi:hypothetical protein
MACDGEDSICHNDLTASHRIVLEMLVGIRHSSPVSYSSFCIDFDSGDAAQIKAVAYSFGVVIDCSSIESSVEITSCKRTSRYQPGQVPRSAFRPVEAPDSPALLTRFATKRKLWALVALLEFGLNTISGNSARITQCAAPMMSL